MDDSGSPRTPDRLSELSGTHVQQLEVLRTMMGACGPNNLGGSTTFPLVSKVWLWKVKESKLLQKNISLPLTIPLMVLLWGKLLLCAFRAVISLRYCHNP